MVDVVYDVEVDGNLIEISLRSWFGSRGTRALDDSWAFESVVGAHAADVLHSGSSLSRPDAHDVVSQALVFGGSQPEVTQIVAGGVRCELRLERGAVITIALRPSDLHFDDLHVTMFITTP